MLLDALAHAFKEAWRENIILVVLCSYYKKKHYLIEVCYELRNWSHSLLLQEEKENIFHLHIQWKIQIITMFR